MVKLNAQLQNELLDAIAKPSADFADVAAAIIKRRDALQPLGEALDDHYGTWREEHEAVVR